MRLKKLTKSDWVSLTLILTHKLYKRVILLPNSFRQTENALVLNCCSPSYDCWKTFILYLNQVSLALRSQNLLEYCLAHLTLAKILLTLRYSECSDLVLTLCQFIKHRLETIAVHGCYRNKTQLIFIVISIMNKFQMRICWPSYNTLKCSLYLRVHFLFSINLSFVFWCKNFKTLNMLIFQNFFYFVLIKFLKLVKLIKLFIEHF